MRGRLCVGCVSFVKDDGRLEKGGYTGLAFWGRHFGVVRCLRIFLD
jgi:hypothetical protein